MRWVIRYVPEFEKRWHRFARVVGCSWRADETYVLIKGRWYYLYRAVDKQGRTVDFLLRKIGGSKPRKHSSVKRLLHTLIDHRTK
jgi:transposase-like protein